MDRVKESDFWPEGVVLRRFFQKVNRDGDSSSPSTINDGVTISAF